MTNGMIFVSKRTSVVGTSTAERAVLARSYDCDATWLNDDLAKRTVDLPAFWIDRSPVTNAEYFAFVEATGTRKPWPRGLFPVEQADHPVVGVSFPEASAYARWVGKRLPVAEEWEVAAQPAQPGLYPWGSEWPGPVHLPRRDTTPRWDLPATHPVGSGRCGRSATGMEDVAGQVCEWTATARTHHGVSFYLLKGASWLHQDPVNYRTAASSWVMGGFYTPLIGFRCALDGEQTPPPVPRRVPPDTSPSSAPREADIHTLAEDVHEGGIQVYYVPDVSAPYDQYLLSWSRLFIQGNPERSRGFVLIALAVGPWPVCLFLAEAMRWNDKQLLAGYRANQPPLQERPSAGGDTMYVMDFEELGVEFEFVQGNDSMDLVTMITNKTDEAGTYSASSCFSLTSHPDFYDCEMLRTYQLTGQGEFVSLRQIPRLGECIRWIAPSDVSQYAGAPTCGAMAVVSRDDQWCFASVRIEPGGSFDVLGNAWLNCLHTDAPVHVGPRATRTTRHRLYVIGGGLDGLKRRLAIDANRGDFASTA